jgi:hypothetical protein
MGRYGSENRQKEGQQGIFVTQASCQAKDHALYTSFAVMRHDCHGGWGGKEVEVRMRRRKPDLLVVLAALIAMGVLFTGITQAMMRDAPAPTVAAANKNK